ncbi:MAG: ABC transporter permease [Fusicatenibacter sp.]|nr:ABC transporter permease [Fusicatenibacter sp.]
MKNPLRKRLLRELKNDIGKYLVIFLFMTATIGFVSGFLVADESMLYAYDESFEKYNIENGNFTTEQKLTDNQKTRLEKEKVTIFENFYKDEEADTDLDSEPESTIRLFKNRTEVNLVCLMKGEMPQQKDEIAIDRMYADNNELQIGDVISVDKKELTITGLVALSDYSALFSNSSDMMFDAVKFGVGIMTEEGYDAITDDHIKYCYSWKYDTEPKDENEEKEWSDDFVEVLAAHSSLTGYLPRYGNQAIKFTGDDMGGDKAMVEVLLYILIAIMAFIFAVTTNNTIVKEASVIGTLRASGYTRRELLLHYLSLPVLISGRLRLSPLRFLRHDFSKKGKSHVVRLPNFRFFSRFRLRILLQNKSSYFTLFLGIVFANILLLFGMMMKPLLSHYQTEAVENMLADYQYILNVPDPIDEDDEYTLMGIVQKLLTPSLKTNTEGVETFAVTSLKNIPKNREGESISVYGIQKDSKYVSAELFENGVTISDGYAEKYGMKVGDTLELKEPYEDKTYSFEVKSIYAYPGALAVFLPMDVFCEEFDHPEDYFNGYFSNEPITDLEESYIATKITEDDMTKISRQLNVSMGEMFQLINVFSIVLFMLLIYLLTKLIIEKNTTSISMVKILGYENREILSLYLTATTWVVIVSIGVSLIIASALIHQIYVIMLSEYSGWLTYYIDPAIYGKMYLMGLAAYAVVAVLQFRHIKKIPMDEALKNVE